MGKKTNGLKEQDELNVPVLKSTSNESTSNESNPVVLEDTAEETVLYDRTKTYSWAMAQLKNINGK
jgi:uncharacterized protein YtpQ (UPF0354 family)